jgi:hypothetical protein
MERKSRVNFEYTAKIQKRLFLQCAALFFWRWRRLSPFAMSRFSGGFSALF